MTSAVNLSSIYAGLTPEHARSLRFYREHAQSYFESTAHLDLTHVRQQLTNKLAPGARVMDAGCGSGRDAKAFAEQGFDVYAFDASPELAQMASAHSSLLVASHTFDDLPQVVLAQSFDAVWACSSLVHLDWAGQGRALGLLRDCLQPGGWLYANFKTGTSPETTEDGRQFHRATQVEVQDQLKKQGLHLQELWLTGSLRSADVQWLNVLATR